MIDQKCLNVGYLAQVLYSPEHRHSGTSWDYSASGMLDDGRRYTVLMKLGKDSDELSITINSITGQLSYMELVGQASWINPQSEQTRKIGRFSVSTRFEEQGIRTLDSLQSDLEKISRQIKH